MKYWCLCFCCPLHLLACINLDCNFSCNKTLLTVIPLSVTYLYWGLSLCWVETEWRLSLMLFFGNGWPENSLHYKLFSCSSFICFLWFVFKLLYKLLSSTGVLFNLISRIKCILWQSRHCNLSYNCFADLRSGLAGSDQLHIIFCESYKPLLNEIQT